MIAMKALLEDFAMKVCTKRKINLQNVLLYIFIYFSDVIVFVSPTIRNIIASIRGTSPMQYSLPVTRPSNVTGKLFGEISITCTADGNPKPLTTWHKKNTNVSFTGELLNFPELNLTQRGFYLCSAVNQENTISSKYIQVDISGMKPHLCLSVCCHCNSQMWYNMKLNLTFITCLSQLFHKLKS